MSETPVAATSLDFICRWAQAAEADWTPVTAPAELIRGGHTQLGTYGTGYDGWGVQTQQKYLATLAAVAVLGAKHGHSGSAHALERALAALRFNLASHKSGSYHCTDGSRWGHTWISALGVERMMFGVQLLLPHMGAADHEALRAMLTSEADWLLRDYCRGNTTGIQAGLWNAAGNNDPESNIWNGALLWRASVMYPEHPHAALWQERAHCFLVNGVSIEADAQDERILAGKPIRERHIGANFFPSYALDHHAYLNVGYMVICLSNAAMLHLDMQAAGRPLPETLDLHQRDLWNVVRQMIFDNGRLARIGGDTRARYAYCQEYLLPSQLFAASHLGDPQALDKIPHQLDFIRKEAQATGSGYFYDKRLAALRRQSPLYYTRLESDRSCALAMLATYYDSAKAAAGANDLQPAQNDGQEQATAAQYNPVSISTSGTGWVEPLHGAAMHRCATRFASFSWRSADIAQGLCLPPSRSDLAEWEYNLCGIVEFCHHPHPMHSTIEPKRRINRYDVRDFDGGFVTCGSFYEGVNLKLAESWSGTDSALHQVAFAALPDGHTVLCLQYCSMGNRRGYVAQVRGLHLNIPADVLSPAQYAITTAAGELPLHNPPTESLCHDLDSNWACVQEAIGVVGLYGAASLSFDRSAQRREKNLHSLYSDCLLWPRRQGPLAFEAGETILDSGWAVLSSAGTAQTAGFAKRNAVARIALPTADEPMPTAAATCTTTTTAAQAPAALLRAVRVQGLDGKDYALVANFGSQAAQVTAAALSANAAPLLCLSSGSTAGQALVLEAGQARLLRIG